MKKNNLVLIPRFGNLNLGANYLEKLSSCPHVETEPHIKRLQRMLESSVKMLQNVTETKSFARTSTKTIAMNA